MTECCFVYRKGTIFQANHNSTGRADTETRVVLYTAKVRFFKQITTSLGMTGIIRRCFVYRKGTIFQANHNEDFLFFYFRRVVLYTAKVRFFKQITTQQAHTDWMTRCFVYRKGTIFQANHNQGLA